MKKRRKFCGFLAFLVLLAVALIPAGKSQAAKLPALKVKGTKLMNSLGRTVQLKGVSTHGLSLVSSVCKPESLHLYEEILEDQRGAVGALHGGL